MRAILKLTVALLLIPIYKIRIWLAFRKAKRQIMRDKEKWKPRLPGYRPLSEMSHEETKNFGNLYVEIAKAQLKRQVDLQTEKRKKEMIDAIMGEDD